MNVLTNEKVDLKIQPMPHRLIRAEMPKMAVAEAVSGMQFGNSDISKRRKYIAF